MAAKSKRKPALRRTAGSKTRGINDSQLSGRTKKQIDSLPEHAQHIYKKAHANAIKQYQNPEKRRGGKRQSAEQVAHKVAWAAVKKGYKKEGDKWVMKKRGLKLASQRFAMADALRKHKK